MLRLTDTSEAQVLPCLPAGLGVSAGEQTELEGQLLSEKGWMVALYILFFCLF